MTCNDQHKLTNGWNGAGLPLLKIPIEISNCETASTTLLAADDYLTISPVRMSQMHTRPSELPDITNLPLSEK